jgi:hypothetical protein
MALAISISDSGVTFSLQWKAADKHLNLEHSPHPQDGGLFLIIWSSSHFHPPWTTTSAELQRYVAARRITQEIIFPSACQSHDTLCSPLLQNLAAIDFTLLPDTVHMIILKMNTSIPLSATSRMLSLSTLWHTL